MVLNELGHMCCSCANEKKKKKPVLVVLKCGIVLGMFPTGCNSSIMVF